MRKVPCAPFGIYPNDPPTAPATLCTFRNGFQPNKYLTPDYTAVYTELYRDYVDQLIISIEIFVHAQVNAFSRELPYPQQAS